VLLVLAKKAVADADRPLLILFRDPNSGYRLSVRTDQAIPEPGSGGAAANDGFDGVKVVRNTFIISRYGGSSVRSPDAWQFRFQYSDWVLIARSRRAGCWLPGSTDRQRPHLHRLTDRHQLPDPEAGRYQ